MNTSSQPLFLRYAPEIVTTIVVWCIFAYSFHALVPSWSGAYRIGNSGQEKAFQDSFTFDGADTLVTVTGTVPLSYIHASSVRIIPDDCLLELSINVSRSPFFEHSFLN